MNITLPNKHTSPKKQNGAVLIVTLTLLFALTILSSFSAKVVVTEQRLSSNEIHIARSSHAADAAVDLFLAQLNDSTTRDTLLTDADTNGQPDGNINGTLGSSDQTYAITITAPTPGDFSLMQVNSIGCSDGYAGTCDTDAPSHKVINQYFSLTSAIRNSPSAPLTARGNVDIASSPDIINDFGTSVVLSGGTYADNAATTIKSSAVNVASVPPYVVDSDVTLASLTGDQFFESFFGASKATIRGYSYIMNCSATCDKNDLHAAIAANTEKRMIWADGDADLLNDTFGTVADPIVLIIDGNLTIRGGANINGLVYSTELTWNATGAGNSGINGAAIAENNIDVTGNLVINFDPTVLSNLEENVVGVARVSGSWIDF